MSAQIAALRALIEQKFPDAIPAAQRTVRPVNTGIPEMDRALPRGGFPLGKLSLCEPGGGATSVLRAACDATVAAGGRAAWVDAAGAVAGAAWNEGPLLVRPRGAKQAVAAGDLLLRCGGFRLVVLAFHASDALTDADTVRLARAAHEGGGALAILAASATTAALRLCARVAPDSYHWQASPFGDPAEARDVRVTAEVRAPGWHKRVTFTLPVESHELRLSLESGLADRRGRNGPVRSANQRVRRRTISTSPPPASPP